MSVKLLTEYHLEFLSLKEGCIGLSESINVKMPHCWKSHVTAHIRLQLTSFLKHLIYLKLIPGLKVIKLEYSLRLKIKRNDWQLVDTCPLAANHCASF